jgi:hypothetical protein
MLRGRDRTSISFGILSASVPLLLFSKLFGLQAGESSSGPPVLVIVPPGSELAAVEGARSAVPRPTRALLVAESDRVRLKGGFEMLVDRSFANAPAAQLIILLSGDAGRAEESFLADRRRTARAIVLPSGSPIAERLRGEGSALVLVGGGDVIAAVLSALGAPARAEAMPAPESPASVEATPIPRRPTPSALLPASTPTPGAARRVFDRYFSSLSPTPTPTPSPR